jgi:Mg-chelatase subunit ChlI
LFLDELPEFRRNILEVMRQPLEDGNITVSRALGSINYPAGVMLVAAMNPCPCGFLTDPQKECVCTPLQIQRYRSRVSGPLLDRIDIQVRSAGDPLSGSRQPRRRLTLGAHPPAGQQRADGSTAMVSEKKHPRPESDVSAGDCRFSARTNTHASR